MATESEQVAEVQEMFAAKGLSLSVERRDGSAIVPRSAPSHGYGFWVDLVSVRTGDVQMRNYGSGPSELLAIMATEQRWLVEQDGSGAMPGDTYVEQAKERLRRNGAAA
jgi:hypothetical protein